MTSRSRLARWGRGGWLLAACLSAGRSGDARAAHSAVRHAAPHRAPHESPRKAPKHSPAQRRTQVTRVPGSRAAEYAALSESACLAELERRGIPFHSESEARGVRIPVRLTGCVGGVLFRTDFPDDKRASVPWEVFDCRLVLSLSDFSQVLRAHAVNEVRIFSAWRPPPKSWPADAEARRHAGALAVDVRELRKESGQALVVLDDFHGRMGAEPCGAHATPPRPATPEATELREIVCAAAESHVFNSILTPNYNRAHRNHFHLELTPGVDWFLVR